MRWQTLLTVAVALGAALALLSWRQARTTPAPVGGAPTTLVRTQWVASPGRVVRTNIVVTNQAFHWRQVESPDYFQYVANLRAIGCPEATIRDIIIADVNQMYARRRAALVKTEHDHWWRSEPDMDALETASVMMDKLDTERRLLLMQLLGPHWEDTAMLAEKRVTGNGPKLTGPVLGQLPEATEKAVRSAWERWQRGLAEAKPGDLLGAAFVNREYRERLENLLTSEQLEEYLLRNSKVADRLRANLTGYDTTPEEFRAIFRALDNADRQLMWATVTSAEAYAQQQQALTKQAEATIERALGKERFREYKFNLDPVYREARDFAQEYEAPPEAVLPVYEIRRATAAEEKTIRDNPLLTADERVAALKLAREQSEAALRQVMGEEAYNRYARSVAEGGR